MRLAFWKKKAPVDLDIMSWNLMVAAIDPDKCWEIAGPFRSTGIPSNVVTCEMSFLMGSVVREIIRTAVPQDQVTSCIASAEAAYFKTFDDESEDPLPPAMADFYGNTTLGHLSRAALAAYGKENDVLFLTTAIFVQRLKGDPRMKYEISQPVEEQAAALRVAFAKAIAE
jgi:hypothetical protein